MEHTEMTCGIDWAENHHDIALVDAVGRVIVKRRVAADAGGFSEMLNLIADHGGSPQSTPIAIETDKNLFVVALAGAGFTVYPVNPRALARYRERHGQAGGKSDPADAIALAHVLRTDRHLPLPANSDGVLRLKALARQHQEAIWALHQTVSRLRSVLLEFYPQAVKAFPNLQHYAATAVLASVPTPAAGHTLTSRRIESIFRRVGRRNDPALVAQVRADLRTPALRQSEPVEKALGIVVTGLLKVVEAMRDAVEALERALTTELAQQPAAPILRSAPGLGAVLAARILAEIGDDTERFTSAAGLRAFAGTAPVTRASGRSHYVKARKVRNKRLSDACHWWAFAALTRSPAARAHYDKRRAVGDHHNAALRNLANKLLGNLWWCLRNGELWDEREAWPAFHAQQLEAAA